MDAAWLAEANEAFDLFATRPERVRLVPEAVLRENGHVWPAGTSELLKGKPAPGPGQQPGEGAIHRPRMGGLYTLPPPHNAPFVRLTPLHDLIFNLMTSGDNSHILLVLLRMLPLLRLLVVVGSAV